jgi:hypothetical protein
MTYDAVTKLQRAIIAVLKADAGLTGAIAGRVYDTLPPDGSLPCVGITQFDETPFNSSDTEGFDVAVQISAYTKGSRCKPEAWNLGALLHAAISRKEASFTPTGWKVVLVERIGGTVFRTDETPIAPEAHGVFRYRFLMEPA